jgi:hypothetical protein
MIDLSTIFIARRALLAGGEVLVYLTALRARIGIAVGDRTLFRGNH